MRVWEFEFTYAIIPVGSGSRRQSRKGIAVQSFGADRVPGPSSKDTFKADGGFACGIK